MNFVISLFSYIPVLNWFIKDAQQGPDSSKILFFFNFVALSLLSIYFIGYPALIVIALAMVAMMFIALISVTTVDAFPKKDIDS